VKPINLNQARKTRARAQAKAKADENAIRFGRSKAERELDAARERQTRDRHAQLKRDDD
jgi:hypothetical protein